MRKECLVVLKYFPDLTTIQQKKLSDLWEIYHNWNQKINVISRKDIDALYLHHVLHSLSLIKYMTFPTGSTVLDIGTGGGFPGIPMAILLPEVSFSLIDGTLKKTKVVSAIIQELKLDNVQVRHQRAESTKGCFDFIVCRAVAQTQKILQWSLPRMHQHSTHSTQILILKGGNLEEELVSIPGIFSYQKIPLTNYFEEEYFKEKFIIHVYC